MFNIQNIFNDFYHQAKNIHKFSAAQMNVARDIMKCRTEASGIHIKVCDHCNYAATTYTSCGNRHCPNCQTMAKEKWIDARKKDLVDAEYFHTVFTVPKELRMIIYHNQELLYNLMFKSVSETLVELSKSPKHIGAQIGFISILHTWSQELDFHPHIHVIILGGGLTKEQLWKGCKKKFFIPAKVLAKKFRGIFMDNLTQYYKSGLLNFYGDLIELYNHDVFASLKNKCYETKWYTYCKKSFAGPMQVIEYLGRYTHRIAISNERIVKVTEESVVIRRKDKKLVTLSGTEFVRRFLMHALPKGFCKIRHCGILSNRNKKTKLALCKKLTNSKIYKAKFEDKNTAEIMKLITGKDISKCPNCGIGILREPSEQKNLHSP